MSYSQAEFIVRFKRMSGFNIYYPMGFDDNGLPTERYVEATEGVSGRLISRSEFRRLCMEVTRQGATVYEGLWRDLGLSVDWTLRFSTIDDRCRRTAQLSFIDLYHKGLLYRAEDPVLWDTKLETALAQADLDWISRRSELHTIRFMDTEGNTLPISTTRPELLAACVAVFWHPADTRYRGRLSKQAVVPMFGQTVPVLCSEEVNPEFGTGLMMVCTFGDGEDVKKWKEHGLMTRICVDDTGRLTTLAAPYTGLELATARKRILGALDRAGLLSKSEPIEQSVAVGDRSREPVEYRMAAQWFVRLLGHEDEFLRRAEEIEWYPRQMKQRLVDWIKGLKYDWNISRQRYFGVPIPVWYVVETGDVIVARSEDLPVDPAEDAPPQWAERRYAGMTIIPETDVMDTWMTSSMSPMINSNWLGDLEKGATNRLFPMSIRVQAHEIIRTWLFYTLVKSHYHRDSRPWERVMISGWGLNERGQKISKQDLLGQSRDDEPSPYDPRHVIAKYGADAIRYWAAGGGLGHDLRYSEQAVRGGQKVANKLWNVARLCTILLEDFDPERTRRTRVFDRSLEDRWVLSEVGATVSRVTEAFENCDFSSAREMIDRLFWLTFCDNYVEFIKDRCWRPEQYPEGWKRSAQATIFESLRTLTALYAPLMPFITEAIYGRVFKPSERKTSIHVTGWPERGIGQMPVEDRTRMGILLGIVDSVRALRSDRKAHRGRIARLVIDVSGAGDDLVAVVEGLKPNVRSAVQANAVVFGEASGARRVGRTDIGVDFSLVG